MMVTGVGTVEIGGNPADVFRLRVDNAMFGELGSADNHPLYQ